MRDLMRNNVSEIMREIEKEKPIWSLNELEGNNSSLPLLTLLVWRENRQHFPIFWQSKDEDEEEEEQQEEEEEEGEKEEEDTQKNNNK